MEKISYDFFIAKFAMEESLKELLLKQCKLLLNKNEKEFLDASPALAGHIKQGKQIFLPNTITRLLKECLVSKGQSYINELSHHLYEINNLQLTKAWVIDSLEGDFNPLHTHSDLLSGVAFLEVPNHINHEDSPEGCLSFNYNLFRPEILSFQGTRTITPRAGDIYLFPSWLPHTAYPYLTSFENERRISLAFNFTGKVDRIDKNKSF